MIVFDLETGGLDPNHNGVATISALHVPSGDSINIMVKPTEGLIMDDEALNITGLSLEQLEKDGVSEKEACKLFRDFVNSHDGVLAACNGSFDVPFLESMYERNKEDCPVDRHFVDLQSIGLLYAEKIVGMDKWPHGRGGEPLLNLDVISGGFSLARVSHLHDGVEDVKLTADCLVKGIAALAKTLDERRQTDTVLVFVDAITSGLNPHKHSLLGLRARASTGESFEVFMTPREDTYANKTAMEYHGVDLKFLQEHGKHPMEAMRDFNVFLRKVGPHILAGKNVPHEMKFIDKTCRSFGLRPPFGGKRFDIESAAYAADRAGKIQLPMDEKGRPDLSWKGICQATGVTREKGGANDLENCILLAEKLVGIMCQPPKDIEGGKDTNSKSLAKLPKAERGAVGSVGRSKVGRSAVSR